MLNRIEIRVFGCKAQFVLLSSRPKFVFFTEETLKIVLFRMEHARQAVDSLLAQSSVDENDDYSEDSEEDEVVVCSFGFSLHR